MIQETAPSYRFASDVQGTELMKAFATMLELADDWKESPCDVEIPIQISTKLEEAEQIASHLPNLEGEAVWKNQLENVHFTLEKIRLNLQQEQEASAKSLIALQLPCFLQELREEIYFRAYVRPYPKRMHRYYREEFAPNHANTFYARRQKPLEVSIFVPAKDKLEYTRQCVESILRETDTNLSYELILINHGSQDETQVYFESIPGAKVLHFKENVRMIMFSAAFRVCEGRYAAFVSNDTVVTKDWLTLLLQCLKSDSTIVSATPTTPNVSNMQGIPEHYQTMEEMTRFAESYNHSDPQKWERRARIMPVIAVYDIEKLNRIGFADRFFETMEFWDDDFSLRARRAGYKQMLCRNVFCHHYGSVTGRQAQLQENSLEKGRRMFVEKHGVDPWENGAYYDYIGMNQIWPTISSVNTPAAVLGVDCGFGDTILQVSNLLRSRGIACTLHGITSQKQYREDMEAVCDQSLFVSHEQQLLDFLHEGFENQRYDYIYVSSPLEQYAGWKRLLGLLHKRLKPGGVLLFSLSNALCAVNYQWFSALGFPIAQERLCYLNPAEVEKHLAKLFASVSRQPLFSRNSPILLEALAKQIQRNSTPESVLTATLDTARYQYLCIGKRGTRIG
ncbi:glycosyltransferase [Oscillospiraceae bacterium MB08-C2-2]|nr:glycosyltransferase [Oscillospiraceae bacterium MB08-C2-2]